MWERPQEGEKVRTREGEIPEERDRPWGEPSPGGGSMARRSGPGTGAGLGGHGIYGADG